MFFRWFVLAIFGIVVSSPIEANGQDSKPGLIATYTDGVSSIQRIESLPNFALATGESVDPHIAPEFKAEWTGALRIDRAGAYRVFAKNADVEIKGESVPSMIKLATGEHPIRIRFKRKSGDAQLLLQWESEFFSAEPVPSQVLRHGVVPQGVVRQQTIDRGRLLFAELGCGNCHSANNWRLQSRRGPDLAAVGSRVEAGWVYAWLKDPHAYRKAAVMPVSVKSDKDRADLTAFVMSLGKAAPAPDDPATDQQLKVGRELFEQVGCAKCHDKENNLDAVGSKYSSAAELTRFIANPHTTDLHGRMPQLFQKEELHLARSVATWLFQTKRRKVPYPEAPAGDPKRGSQLFASLGCASCHTGSQAKRDSILMGPAFGHSLGLPLRHFWDFEQSATGVVETVTGRSENIVGKVAFKMHKDRGRAFEFDGRTFIELPHFHRPDVMTLSVWVKTNHGGSIITWGRPGDGKRGSRELRMNIGQDGKNSLCYGEYNSDGGWKPVIVRPKNINLVDGKWHHIAVVRNGESIQHFVDGKLQGGGRTQPGGGDYTDRLLIGALGLQANPSNRFRGQIDELSVWDIALSKEQIDKLASGTSAVKLAKPKNPVVKPFDVTKGCLAESVAGPLPDYQFQESDRDALQHFLRTVRPAPGKIYQQAPLVLHTLRFQQFGCVKCHEWNSENVQKGMTINELGQIVRVERPPALTGVGHKATLAWLRGVLLEKKRNRPWLNLRMPHFGATVGDLPQLIAAEAGHSPGDEAPNAQDNAKLADVDPHAGLRMIGMQRGKVACINCHDYRGINRRKDGVVPAPDLAAAARTVRYEWFVRWLRDPQRLQPGTSMPQLFVDVSPEERDLRIAQLWRALDQQEKLPLPRGLLEERTAGTRIVVKDRPVLFRMATMTPVGKIDRAINVGIPDGLNYTFDPVTCQFKYAWAGDFIDAGPAWNGRGGNPVRADGKQLVALKEGHRLRIGKAQSPHFLGYKLVGSLPVYRYRVGDATVEHHVHVLPDRVKQRFVVRGASSDIVYEGNDQHPFRSQSGTRKGNSIIFTKAPTVEFEIEFPFAADKK